MSYEMKIKNNNPIVYSIIKNSILNNKISHAYLFSAPNNVEIHYEILYLIQSILNNNQINIKTFADLYTLDGSTNFIKKEQVITAINNLQKTPLDINGKKILLIKNIENSNKFAWNSLLKFLEEPTKNTYIIMTTNNIFQIISTIISRAQVINVRAISVSNLNSSLQIENIPKKHSKIIASIAKSEQDGIKIFQNENYLKTYENLTTILKKAIINPKVLVTSLNKLLFKNNYLLILKLFQVFLNDILKQEYDISTNFKNKKLIEKYLLINFNSQKALMLINDFIIMQSYHINFKLYKIKLLLELEKCYE